MDLIGVDLEKCVNCGLCVEVCPSGAIGMGSQGPLTLAERSCIACGHCVAVCAEAALDNLRAPLENQAPAGPVLDADSAALFLRHRRSIRRYKPEAVAREKILRLLDIARLAPSGGNSQRVSYLVIEDEGTLRAISEATIGWMEGLIGQAVPGAAYYASTVKNHRTGGRDGILRGAPCLIVAMSPKALGARGRDNSHFALGYAELFAPTLGLGTCWTGFVESCAVSEYAPLLALLSIPEKMQVTGGLMVGVPAIRYHRLPDRSPLQVTWASDASGAP